MSIEIIGNRIDITISEEKDIIQISEDNDIVEITEKKDIIEIVERKENIYITEGPQGPQGPTLGVALYVQDTQPTELGPYFWIDTSGGNIAFWVDDGLV